MTNYITQAERRRLAREREERIARRAERSARARGKIPVSIEIMSREQVFIHDCGMVFWRKIKSYADGTCNLCKVEHQPAEIPGFAFARRRKQFDDDVWPLEICLQMLRPQ